MIVLSYRRIIVPNTYVVCVYCVYCLSFDKPSIQPLQISN